ncbi:MAG: hypothetical protein ABIO40_04170 [Devosia sp.]
MTDRATARALVYGRNRDLMQAVPTLLSRAGLAVTLLTADRQLRTCRNVSRFIAVERLADIVPRAAEEAASGYDLVVAGDDDTLRAVRLSGLGTEDKLRLLPICSEGGLGHIASKIGLSHALAEADVNTPVFAVAETPDRLPAAIAQIGYPLMLKADYGMAGNQVFAVESEADLEEAEVRLRYPALVQRRMEGELIDCSGFFHQRKPVAISLSTIIKAQNRGRGPSVYRQYVTHPERDAGLIAALQRIGRALDADGFVSLSAIRAKADGRLYFFEADMRPTTWVEHPKYFGADPAISIAAAYDLPPPSGKGAGTSEAETIVLGFLPRVPILDVLRNTANCRAHYENYCDRNFWFDRLADALNTITLRRVTNGIRRLFGLPPIYSGRRAAQTLPRKISLDAN